MNTVTANLIPTEDLAYMAGIFDGEGSAGIYRSGKVPTISIASNTQEILQIFLKYFGGSIYHTKKEKRLGQKQWSRACRKAVPLVMSLYPYLRNESKKNKFKLILNHYSLQVPDSYHYQDDNLNLHYFGGLFDGEGHAGVGIRTNKWPRPILNIHMSDFHPIYSFSKFFDVKYHFMRRSKYLTKDGRNKKDTYDVGTSYRRSEKIAKKLINYVRNPDKLTQLTKVIEFYNPGLSCSTCQTMNIKYRTRGAVRS